MHPLKTDFQHHKVKSECALKQKYLTMSFSHALDAASSILALCRFGSAETESLAELKSILREHPNVLQERDEHNQTLLHFACRYGRSSEFCKVIIEADHDLVMAVNNNGWLPFHYSCWYGNVETAKYLFSLYPEGINIPDVSSGRYPLHIVLNSGSQNSTKLAQFLLKHDRGAISICTESGNLPLHYACRNSSLAIAKRVFDLYPQAIYMRNVGRRTPLDDARRANQMEKALFFEFQLNFLRQAIQPQSDPHGRWQLPIHKAVQNENVSMGTIKMLIADDPDSLMLVDKQGSTPLHIACQVGDIDVVKLLVETNEDFLRVVNSRGEFPLHIACSHGNCHVINYILDKSDHGVSVKNAYNQLPIQVVLFEADCNRNSLDFVEAVGRLLYANPMNPADLAYENEDV